MNAFEEINSSIETMIQKYCQNLGFDYTFKGVVKAINDTVCVVTINDEDVNCKILNGAILSVGDIALVNVNKNNFSDKFVYGKYGTTSDGVASVTTWDAVTGKPTTVSGYGITDVYTKSEVDTLLSTVSASTYIYNQLTASAIWTITHNLNKYPSVTIVDSAGNVVFGEVQYLSANEIQATFQSEFSGTAYLN